MQRLANTLATIAGILFWIIIPTSFVIHFWSAKLLYDFHGLAIAVFGFFTPIATEFFCFLHLILYHQESFFSPYPVTLIIYTILFILMVSAFVLATKLEEKERQAQ